MVKPLANSGDRGGRDDELTQARVDRVRVLQYWEDHPERGRYEHDRDDQRRLHEAARPKTGSDQDRDDK